MTAGENGAGDSLTSVTADYGYGLGVAERYGVYGDRADRRGRLPFSVAHRRRLLRLVE